MPHGAVQDPHVSGTRRTRLDLRKIAGMSDGGRDRFERMLEMGQARPVFFQGVFPFLGAGLLAPHRLSPDLVYTVPGGCRAALMYFRAGNASDHLIYLSVIGDATPRRYFAIGPQGASHV